MPKNPFNTREVLAEYGKQAVFLPFKLSRSDRKALEKAGVIWGAFASHDPYLRHCIIPLDWEVQELKPGAIWFIRIPPDRVRLLFLEK